MIKQPVLRAVLATVILATAILVADGTARADYGSVSRTALSSNVSVSEGSAYLVSVSVNLAAGERRHVRGRLAATSSTTVNVYQVDEVRCLNPQGSVSGVAAVSSRNHEGSDYGYTNGEMVLYADLLFVAPAAGTYQCQLIIEASTSAQVSYHLTAIANDSFLEISAVDQTGAGRWQDLPCGRVGTESTCSYIGPKGTNGQHATYIWYTDGTPIINWPANPAAQWVDVYTHVGVTTCTANSASCPASRQGASANSVITTRIDVLQMDQTNHICKLTQSTTVTSTIRNDAHHSSITQTLSNVPVLTTCGTRTFLLRVYTAWISGNTVKIDGSDASTAQTSGIMINKF